MGGEGSAAGQLKKPGGVTLSLDGEELIVTAVYSVQYVGELNSPALLPRQPYLRSWAGEAIAPANSTCHTARSWLPTQLTTAKPELLPQDAVYLG